MMKWVFLKTCGMTRKKMREIIGYALEVTWNDGTKEVRTDFPEIEYINEYLDELERDENEYVQENTQQ